MNRNAWTASAIVAAALLASACGASSSKAEKAVASVLHARFDKPGADLIVDPIAIGGAFAVADWTQGAAGGRALLQKGGNGWLLVLCGGDSLRTMQGLIRLGVPQHQAVAIAKELAREEKDVSAERLARMAGFAGEVRM
jgi:hypothetical protein